MTSYHGGKQQIGSTIATIITDYTLDEIEENKFEIAFNTGGAVYAN